MSTENELRPVSPEARLLQLDVLRGLALFGVLLVNIDVFSGSMWALDAKLPYPMGWGGPALIFLRQTLLEGKAAALLGMLFGVGMAIQFESAQGKGRAYIPFALRKVGALALLGIAHSFLLWNLDVLLDYALISLMVMPFLSLRASRLLLSIPILLLASFAMALPFFPVLDQIKEHPEWFHHWGRQHYGAGSWWEALTFRSWEMVHFIGPMRLTSRPFALVPFFVLGVYFWKTGLIAAPTGHLQTLRRLFFICFSLGLLSNLLPPQVLHPWVAGVPQPARALIKLTAFFARPALMVGYAAGVLLLLQGSWWRTKLSLLAPLGRMALTQYLLQSIVCTWIFNGYGLGLCGKVPMDVCILGGVALFAIQVWSSRVWIARWRMGPAEWLWRRMTYGTRQPTSVGDHRSAQAFRAY